MKWIEVFQEEAPEEDSIRFAHMSEASLEMPQRVDLATSLANLRNSYEAAYQTMNPFWRWIKSLFQKNEKNQEIQFLADLSSKEGCTDSIRMKAIYLIHNKIAADEFYGMGSRLKNILGTLAEKRIEMGEEEEESDLTSFMEEHVLAFPDELRDYYLTTVDCGDNSQKNDL